MRLPNFRSFRRGLALYAGLGWFIFFLASNYYLWSFLHRDGLCALETTLEFVLGTAFFLGFLAFVGSSIRVRRAYHAGRFALSEDDREKLDVYRVRRHRARRFRPSLFGRASITGIGFTIFQGGGIALLAYYLFSEGMTSGWFIYGLAGYFSFATMGLASFAAWASMARLRLRQQHDMRFQTDFLRYALAQNALAALIVTAPLGYFYGHLKFPRMAELLGAGGIPPVALALDIGVTVLIIAHFTGSTIRTKVAADLLTDVEITNWERVKGVHGRWAAWYALVLAPLVGVAVWGLSTLLVDTVVPTTTAIIVKLVVQGLVGFGVAYWAASRTTMHVLRAGPDVNPFLSRSLQRDAEE